MPTATSAPSSATSATTPAPTAALESPQPQVAATAIELERHVRLAGRDRARPQGALDLRLPLPGVYNVYNALAAIAAALELGVGLDAIRAGLAEMRAVFGRVETIEVAGKPVSILLIKNPAGANEVLRTLRLEAGEGIDLWIALNDRIADGRDVSWVWDADFELLGEPGQAGGLRRHASARRWPCGSSTRAGRRRRSRSSPRSPPRSTAPSPRAGERLFALPTYTALLELRKMLADRGLAREYWE